MQQGLVVDGRYRVIRPLGSGGMAHVWLAIDTTDRTRVALKVLSTRGGAIDSELIARFKREFRACSSVEHPNVVKLHRLGRLSEDTWYYAMEYLPGPSLDDRIRREGRLSSSEVWSIIEHIAAALAHLHPLGVIHRDLKPANVILRGSRYVIVDFGLARDENRTALTATGAIIGTPLYMAPEQIQGGLVDGRTDIFALGVMAYRLLAGKHPFAAKDMTMLANKVLNHTPPPLEVSAHLKRVVERCMEKEPSDRYSSVEELLDDVKCHQAPAVRPFPREVTSENVPVVELSVEVEPERKRRMPGTRYQAVAILVLLIILTLGVSWQVRRSRRVDYDMRNLRLTSFPGGIVAAWDSTLPYPSKVVVGSGEDSSVVQSGSESVTQHRVVIGGQEEGLRLELRIGYPSGKTSLPTYGITGRFLARVLSVEEKSDSVDVLWKVNAGPRGSFLLSCPEEDVEFSAQVMPDGVTWSTSVPGDVDRMLGLDVVVRTIDENFWRNSVLEILSQQVRRTVFLLDGLQQGQYLRSLKNRVDEALPAATRDLIRERGVPSLSLEESLDLRSELLSHFVDADFREKGWRDGLEKAFRLAPLVFGGRAVSLELRQALYDGIVRMVVLYLYCDAEGAVSRPDLPAIPHLGHWGLARESTIDGGRRIHLFRDGEEPFYMGTPSPGINPPTYSLPLTTLLSDESSAREAELQVDMRSMARFIIRVVINGRGEIVMWDRPLLSSSGGSQRVVLSQRIPPEFLRRGENVFEFQAERILDNTSEVRSRIFSISLVTSVHEDAIVDGLH